MSESHTERAGSPHESDVQKIADAAVAYIEQQVQSKKGAEVFGDVTVTLTYKGRLREVEFCDRVTYRPNQL